MTAIERKTRKEADLRNASNDLFYEFWMFVKLANGLAAGVFGESIVNNALTESFALHVRSVLNFLFNDEPAEEDVVATDYLPNPDDWPYERPKQSKPLQQLQADVRRRVANELADLTYQRHEGETPRKPWPHMQVAKEVTAAVDVFLELAPEHLLGPRWLEVKQQRKQQNGGA